MESKLGMTGMLKTRVIKAKGPGLRWKLDNYLRWRFIQVWIGVYLIQPIAHAFGIMTGFGKLEIVLIKANGERINYGLVSLALVTTAFVNFVGDQLRTETSVFGDFKYHDSGVGTTAAAVGDTDIETTDGESRASGTQAGTNNTYTSVGTISYTTSKAITEHGLFNASTSVTLMDRHVFSAINVVNGDSIQFTYTLTLTAGG